MAQKLAYQCLAPHIKTLHALGGYRLNPENSLLKQYVFRLYMFVSIIVPILFEVQQAIHMYHVRENMSNITNTMLLFLSYTDSTFKHVIFWVKENSIQILIDCLKDELFNQDDPYHKSLLLKSNRNAYVLLRVFNFMTLATNFLWALFPLLLHLNGSSEELPLWMPFETTNGPGFYITVAYSYIMTSRQGVINSTMDCFIISFYAQCKTQLTILRHELENFVSKSKKEAGNISSQSTHLNARFCKMASHFDKVIWLSVKCQDVFGAVMMYQFLIQAWILCSTVYYMAELNVVSVEFISMVTYVGCILIQIYIYCYYGNELKYESMALLNSAYEMDWLNMSTTHRRSLLIYMERIKRPIEPVAGFIIPLSNATFISILRSTYSFYAFLKNST